MVILWPDSLSYVVGTILVGKVTYKKPAYIYAWRIVYRGLTYISLGFNHSIVIAVIVEIVAGVCIFQCL